MSDLQAKPVGPVSSVAGVAAVRPVQRNARSGGLLGRADVAAVTGGSLRGAYAQLVGSAETHDTVIRVRDAATHEVLREYPSSEVEHMDQNLKDYADMLSRRAVQRSARS